MITEKQPSHVDPFFPASEVLKLGERYTSPGTYAGFDIGQAMATFNAHGLVDFDLHRENWGVNAWGQIKIIDFGHSHYVKLSPAIAAESLIPLFMSFEPNDFHAILSGFVTYSTTYIEPLYRNFTHEFLSILGGNIISIPEIRPRVLDLNCAKSDLKFLFCVNQQEKIEAEKTFNDVELFNGWIKASEELFLMAACFIFSGIGISTLLLSEEVAKDLPQQQRALHSFLYKFLNHHLTNTDTNSIVDNGYDQTTLIIGLIFTDLSLTWGYPNPSVDSRNYPIPPDSQPDHMARGMLWQTIRKLPPEFSRNLIDSLIDFDNYLANWLDKSATDDNTETLQSKSSEFAQSSHMLLQYSIYGFDWDEKQVIRISQDLSGLNWKKPKEKNTHSFQIFETLFLNTSGNAFTRLFKSSTEETTLWSYAWEAIDKRRKAIRIISNLINDPSLSKKDEDLINQLFPSLANGLANALLLHQTAVINTKDGFNIRPWVSEKKPMQKEILWAAEIGKYSKSNPIVSEYGRKQIAEYNNLHKNIW